MGRLRVDMCIPRYTLLDVMLAWFWNRIKVRDRIG